MAFVGVPNARNRGAVSKPANARRQLPPLSPYPLLFDDDRPINQTHTRWTHQVHLHIPPLLPPQHSTAAMGRLLAVVAALAGACVMGAQAFIPAIPAAGNAVQQQQGA